MVIETHKEVVFVSGSLCTDQWPVIRTMACLVYEEYPGGVVIDFSRVRSVSEMGESTFVAALEEISLQNLPFRLQQVPARVLSLVAACSGDLHEEASRHASNLSDAALETWWNQIWGNA